jgi:hypothetical protein
MNETDRRAPPQAGRREAGSAPTPQGPKSAGPGNARGAPPQDSPDDSALDALGPTTPDEARPAQNPEAMARRVLDQARQGPPAQGDAGPLAAGRGGGMEDGSQA